MDRRIDMVDLRWLKMIEGQVVAIDEEYGIEHERIMQFPWVFNGDKSHA